MSRSHFCVRIFNYATANFLRKMPKVTRKDVLSEEYERGKWNATHPADEQLGRDEFWSDQVREAHVLRLVQARERAAKSRARKRQERIDAWYKRLDEAKKAYIAKQPEAKEYVFCYYSPFANAFCIDDPIVMTHKPIKEA